MWSLLACHAVLLVAGALAPGPTDPVAVVNGEPISRAEFGNALLLWLGRSAIESFIDWTLVEQEAARRGVAVTPAELAARKALEVDLRMRAMAQKARMGPEEFRAAAGRYGWDLAAIRREVESGLSDRALRAQLLVERMLEPQMDLSERALRAYWRRTRGRRYAAAHILVRTRAQAERLVAALREDPTLWPEAVLQVSLDRTSVPYKGRIPPVPSDTGPGKALAGMKPGELKLYCDGAGWHVLRFVKEIAPSHAAFEEHRDRARAELIAVTAQRMTEQFVASLAADARVVVNLSCNPAERAVLGEQAAAYVNGEPIPASEVAQELVERFGASMLGRYIDRTLIFQKARSLGLSVSEKDVRARTEEMADELFDEQAARRGVSSEELEASLRSDGLDPEAFKRRMAESEVDPQDVRASLLAERMVADGIRIAASDLEQMARELAGESFLVRQLVTDTKQRARRMLRRLNEGGSFDLLACMESGEPGLWMEQGRTLTVTASHPFYPYVKDLKVGEVSGIFEYGGKYRIIKLLMRRAPSEAGSPDPRSELVKREVFLRKARERARALLLKLRAEADVQVLLSEAALPETAPVGRGQG